MSAWADENRWYARLMKLAHDLAMDGRGQEAQDLRVAATHARNYRWLRDHSSPERCVYYLCSDQTQARFNDPSAMTYCWLVEREDGGVLYFARHTRPT